MLRTGWLRLMSPVAQVPKFADPRITAKGEERATVQFDRLDTLWFNTGTLCNIECVNCYIESSPSNDRLAYLSLAEVERYLDEIDALELDAREIGFTGGEPFLNPDFCAMLAATLERGYEVLVLTNAMRPMMRPAVQELLQELLARHGKRLTMRVSLDHHTEELHDRERGAGSWQEAIAGTRWLASRGFHVTVAGRSCWGEEEAIARAGYANVFAAEEFPIDADSSAQLVIFPEMDPHADVPEITTDCWGILGVNPGDMMCASSRMIVKRNGAAEPAVLACTLLPYDPLFELGSTLAEARSAVPLNHVHCAKFCVLGGASCSAS